LCCCIKGVSPVAFAIMPNVLNLTRYHLTPQPDFINSFQIETNRSEKY